MIYLFRHGEIDFPGKRCFVGQIDPPLSATGLEQARYWRSKLAEVSFDRVYCSELIRTRETAGILSGTGSHGIRVIPHLNEINLGRWEGLPMAEVRERYPDAWRKRGLNMDSFRVPDGESFKDLEDRVLPVFKQLASAASGNIMIVAHAGVNRVLLCHLLRMPLQYLFRLSQDYACLNLIENAEASPRVVVINRIQ